MTKYHFKKKLLSILLVLVFNGSMAFAKSEGNLKNPDVVPPQSVFRGLILSEWAAEWQKWALSMPFTRHPLFDTAPCSEGQRGSVWFIDGVNDTTAYPEGGRDCTIPAGTALFLALKTSWVDNTNCDYSGDPNTIKPDNFTEEQLLGFAANYLTGNYFIRKIIIDGVEVNGLPLDNCNSPQACQSPYRVQTVFDYSTPPTNNLLPQPCYNNPAPDSPPYNVTGAVADGVYVMIKPLPVGEHKIEFGRPDSTGGLRIYNITVKPRN